MKIAGQPQGGAPMQQQAASQPHGGASLQQHAATQPQGGTATQQQQACQEAAGGGRGRGAGRHGAGDASCRGRGRGASGSGGRAGSRHFHPYASHPLWYRVANLRDPGDDASRAQIREIFHDLHPCQADCHFWPGHPLG